MISTPIGFILSWHVPTTVSLADLRSGIAAAGFDPIDLAPDLNAASVVARSAGAIAKGISSKDRRGLARKVEYAKRQITAEYVDAQGLTYQREAAIEFDDTTGKLVSAELTGLTQLQATVEETRRATDVTRVVQRVVESAGSDLIQIREQGGAYFVPAGHEVIDKVRTVLEAVGGRLSQFACTIGHGDASDATGQSVANVITDYMLKQIDELNAAVEELKDGNVRSDVKRARLSRVASLKDRVASYATLVGASHDKLERALARTEETLLAKLAERVEVPAEEASEPVAQEA